MNKPKPIWRAIHKPIATTAELMGSLEPYETRKHTIGTEFGRFTDQERRYYHVTEEMKRNASFNNNQKRQNEMMANPDEAIKIHRLRKELSRSNYLTLVDDDHRLFEEATNKHFNKEMNREVVIDRVRGTQSSLQVATPDH